MSFLDTVAGDLQSILEDTETGFARPITVTDPDGTSASLAGLWTDIGQEIDADGLMVDGHTASVFLLLKALSAEGLGVPVNVPEETLRPWVVSATDANGTTRTYKVSGTRPDRHAGAVLCFLSPYSSGS